MIEIEWMRMFEEERDDIRQEAKEKIAKVQRENAKNFNKKRKTALKYTNGDIGTIKQTQLNPGLKISNKFLGPYCRPKVMTGIQKIGITKIGEYERTQETFASADHMNLWLCSDDVDELESDEEHS